jgi:hypothetical protein
MIAAAAVLCSVPAFAAQDRSTGRSYTCFGRRATLTGTAAADRLVGTPRSDVIVGLGGGDRIIGGGGDDLICSGRGKDLVTAGAGDDRIAAEAENDAIFARRGADRVGGGPGSDSVDGGPGVDSCAGDAGRDSLRGCDRRLDGIAGSFGGARGHRRDAEEDVPSAGHGPSPASSKPTGRAVSPERAADRSDDPAAAAEPPSAQPREAPRGGSTSSGEIGSLVEPPVEEPPAEEPEEPPAEEPEVPTEEPVEEPESGSGCDALPVEPGSWPAGCWRPYGEASPFNRQLPASPRLDPDSAAIVSRLVGWGKAQGLIVGQPEGNGEDYGHPSYYASPSDPLYTIHCTKWTSSCPIEGMQVHIPALARPASGTDAHMVVIDQQGGWEYDFWQVHTQPLPASGGAIDISHGGRTRWGTPDATGLGSNATAAAFGLQAGVIRAEEWEGAAAGGGAIDHALFMSVRCTAGYAVYPAAPGTSGLACSSTADAPPIGAHFYLDMSAAQIDALAVPGWKKPILKAMARYGLFVGDTFGGSSNSFGLSAESDVQYRSFGLAGRYAALGEKWGVGTWNGAYVFDIASGVDWGRYLKVVDPCVAEGSC